jgi:hypothetical protein
VAGKSAPILSGDAIEPGSLLLPDDGTGNHSIMVLLPDGQRIYYECFTGEDCARGFRVPSLYRRPEPFALDLLARIHAALVHDRDNASTGPANQEASDLPRDEVVAVLGPDNRVQVEGLAGRLSNGHYAYDLRPLDRAYPRQPHLTFEKSGPAVAISLPSSGLFVLTITDELNTPRIDLFIAALKPAQAPSITQSFRHAKELLTEWKEDYYGWPIHDFERAYLESFMLGAKSWKMGVETTLPGRMAGTRAGVTAEPVFSPKPGLFAGDTAVALRCTTQDAAIHYTVDGSQPTASSPVYGAPIMVKGTELMIKAFASAAGKKDSAVVTGIFRIVQ